jgi:hypothetical protein
MSMLKTVPEGLNPQECKQIKLREPPPVPYVPEKDEVQDEATWMQSLEIKTMIKKDTALNFAEWQENGTREAFLMHVTAVIDSIKKRGHLDNYEKAANAYKKAKKAIAGLALPEETGENAKKLSKKKTKEGKKEASAKAPDPKAPAMASEPKSDAKEAKVAPAANDNMKASFSSDLEKAKQAQKNCKGCNDRCHRQDVLVLLKPAFS